MNRHQAVGSALVFDPNIGQRIPRFIGQVQPQAARILRRLDEHVAVGIALRLCPAGAIDAGGKVEFGLRRRRRDPKCRQC